MATLEQRFRRIGPQLVAEFLGTFALVFFSAAAVIVSGAGTFAEATGGSLATIALASGLILAAATAAAVYISGAQFNPAVSIGLVIAGRQTLVKAGVFILAQLFAAASAAGTLALLVRRPSGDSALAAGQLGATIGQLTRDGDRLGVFGFEFIGTFALMYIILAAAADPRAFRTIGPLAIGGTWAAAILAIGPLSGAALNPARSFGPAMYGPWPPTMHWVYWLAPILGACSAAAVYRLSGSKEIAR